MSGEILRAVLDKSCAFSAPNTYCLDFTVPSGFSFASAQLECKTDRYFLWMATAVLTFTNVSGANSFGRDADALTFTITRSGRITSKLPLPIDQIGIDANFANTMPTYILLEPNDTLRVEIELSTPALGINTPSYNVALIGIEYAR